jgi:cell wall-associated NlpC family hydrolase
LQAGVNKLRSGGRICVWQAVLAAVLLCVLAAGAAEAKAKPDGPYYIQGTHLNVRSKPDGDVQFQLDLNDKVFVVKRDGDWALVSIPALDKKGWVATQFLGKSRVDAAHPAAPAAPAPQPKAAPRSPAGGEKTADDFGAQPGGDLATTIVVVHGKNAAPPAVCAKPDATSPRPAPATPVPPAAGQTSMAQLQPPADAAPLTIATREHYDTTAWEDATPAKPGQANSAPAPAGSGASSPSTAPAPTPPPAAKAASGTAAPQADPLHVQSNFVSKDGDPAVLYPAVNRVNDGGADRSQRDFIPDGAAPVSEVQPAPGNGTVVAASFDHSAAAPAPAPALDIPQLPQAAPAAQPAPKEQGTPSLLFNGDATTVVTSPMMLEGSFFAVGGRDMGKISGSDVNLRSKPDTNSAVLGKLQAGDKLYLTTLKNDWYEVSVPARDLKGWVHSDYVHEFPKVEVKGTQVRLRDAPNTDSDIKDTLDNGEVFYEYERKNGWVKVASSASGINGWVKGDFVRATDRSPSRPYSVQGDDVNFRASPQVDADIIARLPQGTQVQVFGRNEKWSYIQVQGRYGWMYSEYLLPGSKRGFVVPSSPVGLRLIARAKAMEGTPYVWGGESDDGVDCSGLIYKILLDEGASGKCLPRRASEQMAQLGLAVDKEDLQPGDLVFFTTYKPGPSHVGIYLGDGNFIHASSAQHKVAISSLSERYYKERFCGARRITEDEIRSMKPE